jgi:hypothetical protein
VTLLIGIYLLGVVAVIIYFVKEMKNERTSHGQGVLLFFGACLSGLWPLAAIWFLILSPWLVWRWWKGRRT